MGNLDRLLDEMSVAVAAHDWDRCAEQSFRLLYPLSAVDGRDAARTVVARFAETLGDSAPHAVVADPAGWYRDHGRDPGEPPATTGVAQAAWLGCLDALLLGVAAEDQVIRTAAWATAIVTAVNSRALAVWEVDDPPAVTQWREGTLPPWRSYLANAPARAVLEREWWWVVRRLAAAARSPAAEPSPEQAEAAVARWREHEHGLIPPP